jgi:hypothetical protein
MNDDTGKRAEEFVRRLGGGKPSPAAERAQSLIDTLTGSAPRRETEKQRDERRIVDQTGKAKIPGQGGPRRGSN